MREFLDNLRNSEFFQNKRNLIILAVLVLTLPVGIFLITQQQIFKSRAAGEPIEFSGNNVERRGNSWVALRADQPITLKLTSRLGSGNTPTPTPPASVPSTPTNPSASCPDPGTAAKFSWTGVSGATRYDLYVHNTADPALVWGSTESGGNACTPPNFCEPLTSTSKSLTGRIPGATYQWFVFACNASGCSTGAAEGSFTCTRQVAPATPTVSFTASPTTITAGQSTTLTWSSTNAVKCILNPPGVFKTVDASGSDTFSPTETTTYNMRCEGVGGAANSARVSVAVTVNPPLPCTGKSGAGCKFDTRTMYYETDGSRIESITAYGRYWNFRSPTSGGWITLEKSGDYLTTIPRYANGPCSGQSICTFDTRNMFVQSDGKRIETITANGKYWNFDGANGWAAMSGSGSSLTSVDRYASGPCSGRSAGSCKFDTRTMYYETDGSRIESITAYGRYWNFRSPTSGGWEVMSGSGSSLTSVDRYASGPCSGQTTCTFDSRTMLVKDGKKTESITAYGKYWNFDSSTGWGAMFGNGTNLSEESRYK